jgi:hypothetical protein
MSQEMIDLIKEEFDPESSENRPIYDQSEDNSSNIVKKECLKMDDRL